MNTWETGLRHAGPEHVLPASTEPRREHLGDHPPADLTAPRDVASTELRREHLGDGAGHRRQGGRRVASTEPRREHLGDDAVGDYTFAEYRPQRSPGVNTWETRNARMLTNARKKRPQRSPGVNTWETIMNEPVDIPESLPQRSPGVNTWETSPRAGGHPASRRLNGAQA